MIPINVFQFTGDVGEFNVKDKAQQNTAVNITIIDGEATNNSIQQYVKAVHNIVKDEIIGMLRTFAFDLFIFEKIIEIENGITEEELKKSKEREKMRPKYVDE